MLIHSLFYSEEKLMLNKPSPTGEYAVGTFTYTVYNDREEVIYPGTKRSIPARVYYPVSKESVVGMDKARYMSRAIAEGLKKVMHAPIDYDKMEASGENVSECYENAPRIEGIKFPLVVFSHGLASYIEANSFLLIDIASHGYVVISVGHPYDGSNTKLDDGTVIPFYKKTMQKQYDPYLPGVFKLLKLAGSKGTEKERAEKFEVLQKQYCKVLIDRIEEWKKDTLAAVKYAKENLNDLIDFEPGIAVAGHSLGGATAYELCLDYEEFVCGANIDGAPFGNNAGKILRKPFLQLCCKANAPVEARFFVDHTKPVYKAVFDKMQHAFFSDMKHMMKPSAISGKLDPDFMHENVCKLHLELFDTYLKKIKDHPEFESKEAITITEYQPDITD